MKGDSVIRRKKALMFGYAEGVMRGYTHLASVAFVASCNAAANRRLNGSVFVL